jgi:hypothetical protein
VKRLEQRWVPESNPSLDVVRCVSPIAWSRCAQEGWQ